jgi:hypothetical protein
MQAILIKRSNNLGDLIAELCGIKAMCERYDTKAIIYQHLDVPAVYANNAKHPTISGNGEQVMMNKGMFEMMKPLLLSQNYIEDYIEYNGQKVDIDLDAARTKLFTNMPLMPIQSWIMLAFPDLHGDISEAWLTARYKKDELELLLNNRDKYKEKRIICFTDRYRNNYMDYFFLKEHEERLLFSGTEKEHKQFLKKWNLSFERIDVNNFLELSQILKASKFLLSNQTFIWNLAEAMKHPRLLELYEAAPNCIPFIGNKSYGYYYQSSLEYYFNQLLNS